MNRQVPPSLRPLPGSFGNQQQPQQPGRSASNRLANGRLGSNGSGWAFGAGIPMSGGGLQNPSRQLGGNLSFAQSLGGSQPLTPLDPSDFPSLTTNSQLQSASQSSMWSAGGSRSLAAPGVQRNQGSSLGSQQGQQDDLFGAAPRLASNPGSFRFGNQASIGQSSQAQSNSAADDFPPLNRNANGEIGQERGSSLMSNLGFGAQPGASSSAQSGARAANGLLNALSANTRAAEARSPVGTRPQDARGSLGDDDARQKQSSFRQDSIASQSSVPEGPSQSAADGRNPLGAIGKDGSAGKAREETDEQGADAQDPLAGMAPIDRWGLKGLSFLMHTYPDYNALINGIDINTLGLDLNSTELISTQIYSPFDDVPPRPAVPKFRLPECYKVTNVGPIDSKINSFNEETLMWIFYSCPNDIKQHFAAQELQNRNWRWHKKHQIWLTKDDMMMPQVLSNHHERGYYIIWDTTTWRKERREFTLHYADLDVSNAMPGGSAQ